MELRKPNEVGLWNKCLRVAFFAGLLLCTASLRAHPLTFNSTVSYSSTQPTDGTDDISNWTGAAFDADNIGGSGVNADGGSNNGTANDATTYVANNQPRQGQTFTTGSNPDGYQLTAVTARMAGYTNNNATGYNRPAWDLNAHNGPIQVEIGEVNGTSVTTLSKQMFIMGRAGNPGSGRTTNGAGTYITFELPFTTYLEPNMTYSFDFWVGNGSSNYFEWLGTQNDEYTDGTAFTREWWGGPIIPQTGERVFQLELTALSAPAPTFAHPGTLHSQADLDRMKAKVAANEEPWLSGYNMLLSSPYNNLGWPAYDVDYIVRGSSGNNYTRCQQDAQLIYTQALIWHVTGNTAYADRAVQIANVWSDLLGVTGDSNKALGAGICGYLFAISGELLSTYPGWPEAEKQAYKDMMMRVFYPQNLDFLWRKNDTFWREEGNAHYRLNWESANMASMAAIGVLCDNRAVYEQAIDFFKYGPGVGRIERAAYYVHPDGTAHTEEVGRDQGHNLTGWYQMALLCQTAWNQGDDLFSYDNNRVLRAVEHTTKWNLWYPVPDIFHSTTDPDMGWAEGTSWTGRGTMGAFHELIYNHYVNIEGMAAPYNEKAAEIVRPERWPDTANHPSEVDWLGHGTLTYSLDPIATPAAPSGLQANWSENQIIVNWMGTARATGYNIKRATTSGGPYTQIGTSDELNLYYTDTDVVNGQTYYYVISANTAGGETADSDELMVSQRLVAHYTFEGNADDVVGSQDGTLCGGSTGLPTYSSGFGGGQAINLDGVDDYVQLPKNIANYQDITVAAWVNWDGGAVWQRVFDFGAETNKNMYLTTLTTGGHSRFKMTTSRGLWGTGEVYGSAVPTGTWTHMAVSLRGDVCTLYINGVPSGSSVIDLTDPLFGQPFCYIGKSMWNPDPLFNGRIDDFRIYNYGLTGDEVYTLWDQSPNHPPVFNTDPIDDVLNEDTAITGTLASYASDADSNPLTFSKLTGPSWLSVASNGTLSGTPTNDNVGENVFVVRVTDSIGAADDAYLIVTVLNVNDAPTWNVDPITGATIATGMEYSGMVGGLASDVDAGDTLTYSKVDGPFWLNVAADGTLSGTPGIADAGDNSFTLRAMDNQGAYADATLLIHVDASTTIAWWKFEEGTAGDEVPGTSSWTTYQIGTPDLSGNGNHLCDFWDGPSDSGITYSSNVPTVSGLTNTLSGLSEGGSWPSMFTWSDQSTPLGIDLETAVLNAWTIEAFVYPTEIAGSNRGIVGRDGKISSTDVRSPLYFNIQSSGTLRCKYYDQAAVTHEALSSVTLTTNRWYYVATTCDGANLKLWLADLTAGETTATQVASVNVSGSPDPDFGPWPDNGRGNWSVFRGYWDSGDVDRFMGNIDEVRISAAALDVNTEGLLNPNTMAPSFITDPISNVDGIELAEYAGDSLATYAQDADGIETVTFSKDSGPDWLIVAGDGTLSGTPSDSDVGENIFTVRVTDNGGLFDTATMTIYVANIYSGTQGIDDLLGLAAEWLMLDCTDIPACNGADLDGDADVDMADLAIVSQNWLLE